MAQQPAPDVDLVAVGVSEPGGRANHEYGSFLATKWRALIGVGLLASGSVSPTSWMVHQ